MDFMEWFDINNPEHLKAYKYLNEEGHWQKDFIPKNIIFPHGWTILLDSKLANAYIELKLKEGK